MNGTEQRAQGTRTAQLTKQIEDQGLVIEALAGAMVKDREAAEKSIGEERTHRLKLADEQRAYVDHADRLIAARVNGVLNRGFWGRLRWLVTGR